jgi:uncharacterized phage protein (TIGR01671 family)
MSREIKFRGMDIKGNWYYGNLAILKEKVGPVEPSSYISNAVGMPFACRVRPETVGQFTGLSDTDINDKEFWEGDIIRVVHYVVTGYEVPTGEEKLTRFEDVVKIVWLDGSFVVRGSCIYDYAPLATLIQDAEEVEIIGTVHQNPELLEAK